MREVKPKEPKARLNAIDRVVSFFDPVKGAERLRARFSMALVGGYIGADKSRRNLTAWRKNNGDADTVLLGDLQELRNASRDLVRNAPIAGGAIATVVTNVVGTGLALQSEVDRTVLKWTEEQAEAWQNTTESEFSLWADDPVHCDLTKTQDFYAMQDLVLRSTLEAGDIFSGLPMRERKGCTYALKVQLIEADRVCNENHQANTTALAGGVELDEDGAAVRYHVLKTHPGALNTSKREWQKIDAFGKQSHRRNVLHHFKRLRPGQNRGVPYLAAVIEPLKQLDRYSEAELSAAVVSSLFTVFVKTPSGAGLDLSNQQGIAAETGAKSTDSDMKLASGMIVDLAENESIETADPSRPNVAFDPFVQAVIRQIGVRLELPFEVLIKHYTASYSAARAALLDAWRFFMVSRDWMASSFCQPVYEAWMDEAVARGRIVAPGYFLDPRIRKAYLGAQWVGDGPGSIDPLKEINAAEKRMENDVTTLSTEVMAYNGRNWRRVLEQRKRERKLQREAGGGEVQTSAAPASAADPEPDQDKPDNDKETT